jgi:hypothetical protein
MMLLLSAGVVSFVCGVCRHPITVEEEKERDVQMLVPAPPTPGQLPFGPPEEAAGPEASEAPPAPPGMKFETVTEKYVETLEEPEPTIVREVTVGGVALLANGHLKRTYSGKPPALCPT